MNSRKDDPNVSSTLSEVLDNFKTEGEIFIDRARTTLEKLVEDTNERNLPLLKDVLHFLQDLDCDYTPAHHESADRYWDELTLPSIWEEIPKDLNPKNILYFAKIFMDEEEEEIERMEEEEEEKGWNGGEK